MTGSSLWPRQRVLVAAAILFTQAACGTNPTPSLRAASARPTDTATRGGTIYVLTQAEQWDQVDPQRVYTPEDVAFFGATIYRSLETFAYSPDATKGTTLVPDLATDTGRHNADATQWSFTLRPGVTWQDDSPVTCEDVKFGVSRTFATDTINQGPTYAISYLDIPYEADGTTSQYKGPYKKFTDPSKPSGEELFDRAVTCDGDTITFNLNKPVADFNYAVTLGFSPVSKIWDTGELYGQPGHPIGSDGPYMVKSYSVGVGGKMVLVRNPNWDPASDPVRKAYPDRWEVDFALDPKVIDQRLMASAGNDQTAIDYGSMQPENLATVFSDPDHSTRFSGRAVSAFDPYVRYFWVNVDRVPDINIRRAMWVALDRQDLRRVMGAGIADGALVGDYADGVLKPSIGTDYSPTGLLDGSRPWLQGRRIPDAGDPEFAKQLIGQAGNKTLSLTFLYSGSPGDFKVATVVKTSLERAGFTVELVMAGSYFSPVFDPYYNDFGIGGWGADWPNASTVLPRILGSDATWNLSQLHDSAFDAKIETAREEIDPAKQAALWQALDREVVENMYVIPTLFSRSQNLAGTKVGPIYRWPAYSSWPYGAMYVKS